MQRNSPFTNHLSRGLSLEHFIISDVIDEGARVFKCTNHSRTYAVKIITIKKVPLSNHKEQEAKLQEIQREINILQKIEEISPKPSSIIPFYGYYISENASKDQDFCFVFEHLNQSLNTLIEDDMLTPPVLLNARNNSYFFHLFYKFLLIQQSEIW